MTMPAGTYYIGDLCYVMHDKWNEICGIICDGDFHGGEFQLEDGTRLVSHDTAYGDGLYWDESGNAYGVDAGLIGCVLVSDISEQEQPHVTFGHVHVFDAPFSTRSVNGVIQFGGIRIDTDN